MKNWKQKNPAIRSLEKLIEENTGMPISEFLNPKPDPYIKNLSLAVGFVREKILSGTPIKVVSDYDCDGAMSTAILDMGLKEYILSLGMKEYLDAGKFSYRIPKRRAEGYGLNTKIIDEIDEGLIITVDNGISAVEAIQKAKDKGLSVVILDHHEKRADGIIPNADVVVDPSAISGSEFTHYCGAAIAYRFIKELNPNSKILDKLLVFASIATVSDVMELVGDNRLIVQKGLELINKRKVTQGLNTLLDELKLTYIDEETYGFSIGPVVNASGRLYDDGPNDVVALFTNDCNIFNDAQMEENFALAKLLIKRNEERQDLVKKSMAASDRIIKENKMEDDSVMVVYDSSFDEGIIGIIAGKLAEQYKRAAIVFTDGKAKGIYKGSGRNYGDIHLKEMLDYSTNLFVGYGGHKGAAGMSIPGINVNLLRERSAEYLVNVGWVYDPNSYYDLEITEAQIPMVIKELKKYAPFGQGNPRPIIKIVGYSLSPKGSDFFKVMGKDKNHLKLFGKYADAIGFSMVKAYEEAGHPKTMDIIANLSQNYFNGKFTDQVDIIEFESKEVKPANEVVDNLKALLTF